MPMASLDCPFQKLSVSLASHYYLSIPLN